MLDDYIKKILVGDCEQEMARLPENSIDLVVTSPPYNVGIEYDVHKDNMKWGTYYAWCKDWMKDIYRILKDDGRFCLNHYLSFGTAEKRVAPLMDLNTIAKTIGFKHHSVAIWTDTTLAKGTAWGSWLSASAPYINSPYEGILILYKNQWKKENSMGISTIGKDMFMKLCQGVWRMPADRGRLTPATFPLELPIYCICLLTYENDIVLDPFAGSGTTLLAAEQLKRQWIGIEISPVYAKIAKHRVQNEINQLKLKGV